MPQLLSYAKGEPSDLRTDAFAFDALASIPGNTEESVPLLTAAQLICLMVYPLDPRHPRSPFGPSPK